MASVKCEAQSQAAIAVCELDGADTASGACSPSPAGAGAVSPGRAQPADSPSQAEKLERIDRVVEIVRSPQYTIDIDRVIDGQRQRARSTAAAALPAPSFDSAALARFAGACASHPTALSHNGAVFGTAPAPQPLWQPDVAPSAVEYGGGGSSHRTSDGGHRCPHCAYVNKNSAHLQRHIVSSHTASGDIAWLACPHDNCAYEAKFKSDLRVHCGRMHGSNERASSDGILHCGQCNYTVNQQWALDKHVARMHTERDVIIVHQCEQCQFNSESKAGLTQHVARSHKAASVPVRTERVEQHTCRYCGALFALGAQLEVHTCHGTRLAMQQSSVSPSPSVVYACMCGMHFASQHNLMAHYATEHTPPPAANSFQPPHYHQAPSHVHTPPPSPMAYVGAVQCARCPFTCGNDAQLEEHTRHTHHSMHVGRQLRIDETLCDVKMGLRG